MGLNSIWLEPFASATHGAVGGACRLASIDCSANGNKHDHRVRFQCYISDYTAGGIKPYTQRFPTKNHKLFLRRRLGAWTGTHAHRLDRRNGHERNTAHK